LDEVAIQSFANYDEAPETNSIRTHIKQQTELLIDRPVTSYVVTKLVPMAQDCRA